MLGAVAKQLGSVPKMFRSIVLSPQALKGYLGVKAVGYTDAQAIEIVQHVALNSRTNFFNEVFQTEIDFPRVETRKAA